MNLIELVKMGEDLRDYYRKVEMCNSIYSKFGMRIRTSTVMEGTVYIVSKHCEKMKDRTD